MGSNAHTTWFTKTMPQSAAEHHDPYGDDALEDCPLAWDTHTVYMTDRRLGALGETPYISDAAKPYQGSYWPNEPPILPPSGFYWYDYGPLARGMHYWRAIPLRTRPSPHEQAATLAKHREAFKSGRVPEGLKQALHEHGLELPPSKAFAWWRDVAIYTAVFSGFVAVLLKAVGLRKRGT